MVIKFPVSHTRLHLVFFRSYFIFIKLVIQSFRRNVYVFSTPLQLQANGQHGIRYQRLSKYYLRKRYKHWTRIVSKMLEVMPGNHTYDTYHVPMANNFHRLLKDSKTAEQLPPEAFNGIYCRLLKMHCWGLQNCLRNWEFYYPGLILHMELCYSKCSGKPMVCCYRNNNANWLYRN